MGGGGSGAHDPAAVATAMIDNSLEAARDHPRIGSLLLMGSTLEDSEGDGRKKIPTEADVSTRTTRAAGFQKSWLEGGGVGGGRYRRVTPST